MAVEQYVAERFWPGVTEAEAMASMVEVRASCEQLARAGVPVRWLGGTFLAGDECVSLRFEGTAQAVRAAHDLAGVPFDRMVPSMDDPSRPSVPGQG
jgi:hypothetical protein